MTQGADMTMTVAGRDVCAHSLAGIAATAKQAALKTLMVVQKPGSKTLLARRHENLES